MTEPECQQAAKDFGGTYLGSIHDENFPSGCIMKKSGDIYFNSHPSGQGQRGWSPVGIEDSREFIEAKHVNLQADTNQAPASISLVYTGDLDIYEGCLGVHEIENG